MSSNEEEAGEILRGLLRLQAEQTDLLSRLARLEIGRGDIARRQIPAAVEAAPRPATPETLNDEREEQEVAGLIVIGSFVRVRNPKEHQPNQGHVVGIDKRFVSVKGRNGIVIRREPHNLELFQEPPSNHDYQQRRQQPRQQQRPR